LLLLDEPFGALDALTRGNLQQQLMQICQQAGVTTVMVTHSVDEALLLSDRVVCLTNGPEAGIGQILNVNLPRPRQRLEVMEHPDYYRLRSELISFLQQQRRLKQRKATAPAVPATAPAAAPQAPQRLRVGYLPGLDIAPLAVALERGFFSEAQLSVLPVSFHRWQQLEEKLRAGEIDMGILALPVPLDGLEAEPLYEEPFTLAVPAPASLLHAQGVPELVATNLDHYANIVRRLKADRLLRSPAKANAIEDEA
jgi:nitrate/nitrite transport system ATP-binding protein